MNLIPLSKKLEDQNRLPTDKATPEEAAEFNSSVGSFHWPSTQSRPDVNAYSNMLQKCQADTMVADIKEANRLTREIMTTADMDIRILLWLAKLLFAFGPIQRFTMLGRSL